MRARWLFGVISLIVVLAGCSVTVSTNPVVDASVTSAGSSSRVNGSFTITWTCRNTGTVPISIISPSTLIIRGSNGVSDSYAQTGSTLVYGIYFNPGESYTFTIDGNAGQYTPYFYDATLTFADKDGNTKTDSQSMVALAVN